MRQRRPLTTWIMALAVLLLGTFGALAQERQIGVTSAVNPNATGFPPISAEHELSIGTEVVSEERVVTTTGGQAQMLFLDGSALTIGPNSQVALDRFVYDPDAKTGELVISATKGLFRLVGGRISKTREVVFKTPTATIGIRGGITIIRLTEDGRLEATFLFGQAMNVLNDFGLTIVTRPGFAVQVAGAEAAPSAPVPASAEALGAALAGLEGSEGETGGVEEPPQDEDVAAAGAGVEELGSATEPEPDVRLAEAPTTDASEEIEKDVRDPKNECEETSTTIGCVRTEGELARAKEELALAEPEPEPEPEPPPPPPPPGFTTPFTYSGAFFSDPRIINYDDVDTFTGDANPARNFTFTDGDISNGRLTATLASNIDLPAESGPFSFGSAGTTSLFGPVSGTGFVSDDLEFFAYQLNEVDAGNNPAFIFGGVPTPQASFPTSGFAAHDLVLNSFAFQPSPSGNGINPGTFGDIGIPFLTPSSGGDIAGAVVSPLFTAYHPNLFTFPDDGRSVSLQASLAINGQGAGQQSVLAIGTQLYFEDIDTNTIVTSGGVRSASRLSSTSRLVRTGSGTATMQDGTGNAFFGADGADYFVLNADFYTPGSQRVPALGFEQPHNLFSTTQPSNFSNFDFTAVAVAATPPEDLGVSRMARTINGYAAGIMESRAFRDGPFTDFVFNNVGGNPFDLSIETVPSSNRIESFFHVRDIGSTAAADEYVIPFGILTGPSRARQAFIDDDRFAARDHPLRPGTLGGAEGFFRGGMVTQHLVPVTNFLPSGVSFCVCEFLQWGYWTLDFIPQSGPESGRRDRTHLATWVAGALPGLAAIPAGGTATYDGHIIGEVKSGGNFYVAAGDFELTWDFAARDGGVTITSFDGVDFTGSATSANGREFSGAFTGGGRVGALDGSFFAGGGDPVTELGGEFDISGTNYIAGGTFAAAKTGAAPPGGLTLAAAFSGRAKHASTLTLGSDDETPSLNLGFTGGTVSGGVFDTAAGAGRFTINIEPAGFAATSTEQPFGPAVLTGNALLFDGQDFVIYDLLDGVDGHNVFVWAGVPTPLAAFPTSGVSFYALRNDVIMNSAVPFILAGAGGGLIPPEAETAFDTGIVWDVSGSPSAQRVWGHRTIVISGQGASQQSAISVAGGEVLEDGGGRPFLDGGFGATARLAAGSPPNVFDGDLASSDDGAGNDFFGAGGPNYFVLEAALVDETTDAVLSRGAEGFVGGTVISYFPNNVAVPATAPAESRTSRDMFGYSGGLVQAVDSLGDPLFDPLLFRNATGDPSDVIVRTSAETNKVQADISVQRVFPSVGGNIITPEFGDHDVGAFGDASNTSGDSIFINDAFFGAALEEASLIGDGSFVAGTITDAELFIVTVDEAGQFSSGFVPAGVSLCTCEFLSWGFWGGAMELGGGTGFEIIHLANWVAGEIATLAAITALGGTASYSGHAIGTVLNGSDVYQAVGDLDVTVNFDSDLITAFDITSFDGGDYALTAPAAFGAGLASRNIFPGAIEGVSGTALGRTGSFLGSFMSGGGDPAAEMGGHFQASGTGYSTSGVFAAAKTP